MDVHVWLKVDSKHQSFTACVLDQYIIHILLIYCQTAGFLELDIKSLFKSYV